MTATLLADGTSDRALLPVLAWLLRFHAGSGVRPPQWADVRDGVATQHPLASRIQVSVARYPCDVLFVHRDAERESPETRKAEVETAAARASVLPRCVCVIPVRMTEAWLLHDETAIRRAAGNPNGRAALSLPPLHTVERLPDPKETLRSLLRTASGYSGRRLKDFVPRPSRVADLIADYAPLRELTAFQCLEQDVRAMLTELNLLRDSETGA